jgi:hypothetical protein
MALKPFDHSRIKVNRARHHIGELREKMLEYLRRNPFFLRVEAGPISESKQWTIQIREEVPVEFSAIIGDVIHNLRAALDLAAVQLVRLNGQSDEDAFSKTAEKFDEVLRNRNMQRASPEAVELVKSLKPYNDQLRALHDLDIMDKHQALIPTADMIEMPPFLGGKELKPGIRVPIREGASAPVDPEMTPFVRIGHAYQGTFCLEFPSGQAPPLGGKEIIPALIRLANSIEQIVESFADLYR